MTNGNNDVRELEDLLTELEGQGALPVGHYSEEDDAVTQLMDAPLGEQEWMVQVTPHDRRMMSTEQLLGELATGNLVTPEMLVWRSGMKDWGPISSIDELRVGRAVMEAPERRPLPLPPPPTPLPPRLNSNGIGSSTMASPSPIGRAPLPPPPSVPYVPAPPPVDLTPAPLPVFGAAAAPTPSALPERNPFAPPTSRGSAPGSIPAPAPASPRVNTHGPVAVDFSEMEPPRSMPTRTLVGSAIAAVLMIGGTVYALSAGGVFESTPRVSSEVASSKPAVVAPAAAPAAAMAPKVEPEPAQAAPAAPSAPEPQTQPASVKDVKADDAVASAKSEKSDEGDKAKSEEKAEAKSEEASSSDSAEASVGSTSSKSRKGGSRRNRRASAEEPERAKAEPRHAPERRSKARAAAAAPEVARAEESEEAPKAAEQPGSTFNKQAAKTALDDAAAQARNCRPAGGPSGAGKVQVRYEPNGKVGAVTLMTPAFENTTTGDCVVMVFRRASIPAFAGTPAVVMNKSFEIP